ncbi:MAG: D-alanine--D-alanine ligase [Salinivirgaceae bacterium]|nr:MAG: D-alanine--D-alanine ligase [Salinivirgaceae bacterium]
MKKKIALVSGGYSKEDVVSFNSAKEIAVSIDPEKYEVFLVLINREKWVYIDKTGNEFSLDKNDFTVKVNSKIIEFDAVFITIHGTPGEDGKLQGYFDMIKMPYNTCNAFTSSLTFNKVATKKYLETLGIKTAPYFFLRRNQNYEVKEIVKKLGLPMFVKPNAGGSSFGVTKVKEEKELANAIENAFAEDNEVLIESFIDGTEVTCGLIKTKNGKIIFPATEIVSKNEFFDYDAKYNGEADEITPARITDKQMEAVKSLSSDIYDALDCFGIVRIDYLMRNDELFVIEANTVPGMSAASIVPQQAEAYGMTTRELFSIVLQETLERKA